MTMMIAVILSALLIRVSLVCQGFPGFHQRHNIGILSHTIRDEEKYEVDADEYEEDAEQVDVDEDEAERGPGPIYLSTPV